MDDHLRVVAYQPELEEQEAAETNPELERLTKRLSLIRDRVRSVALGYHTGFFLFGEGGSGKSFAVRTELESLNVNWRLHNSAMTAAGLFEELQETPDHIHVFEDMEGLYRDMKAVGFLRSATWGDSEGCSRIITKTKHKCREQFEFVGGIIILSNLPLGENSHLAALATRLNPAELCPTEPEKEALVRFIASGGKFGLTPDVCGEVAEYVIFYAKKRGKPIDLRLLDNALNDRRMYDAGDCRTNWRDMVASRIDAQIIEPRIKPRKTRETRLNQERNIALNIYSEFPSSREDRCRRWLEETGKSERALYRRAAEIGLDAEPS